MSHYDDDYEDEYADEEDERPRRRRARAEAEAPAVDEDDRPRRRRTRDDDDDEAESPRRRTRNGGGSLRRGWSAAQQVLDQTSDFAKSLRLSENVQLIKFLEDSPYASYSRHWVELGFGKERKTRAYTCLQSLGKDCPLCEEGDRPQAVSSFNVALLGDDGGLALRSWDVGPRLLSTIKTYNLDKAVGPITRGFYAVSRRGQGRNNTTYTVLPVKEKYLAEDYDVDPPSERALEALGLYDESVVEITSFSELQRVAEAITEGADYR